MGIKYKKISPCIWNDSKVHQMSNDGKLAFVYMLTHPNQTSIGAIRTTVKSLGYEMDSLLPKAFEEAFALGMALESSEAPLVWFPNFQKYNKPESPNVAMSWGKSILDLPHCYLRNRIYMETYSALKLLGEHFVKALHKGLGEGEREGLVKDYALSEAVTVAIKQYHISSCYTHVREGDSFVHPETGEVIRDN